MGINQLWSFRVSKTHSFGSPRIHTAVDFTVVDVMKANLFFFLRQSWHHWHHSHWLDTVSFTQLLDFMWQLQGIIELLAWILCFITVRQVTFQPITLGCLNRWFGLATILCVTIQQKWNSRLMKKRRKKWVKLSSFKLILLLFYYLFLLLLLQCAAVRVLSL